MKYWGFLVAKLVVAAVVLYAGWFALYNWYPVPPYMNAHEMFLHDLPWTTLMFVYNLVVQGVLFLIIWDQRYRCRTCARRLRMPVSTGSHAHVLFGPPRTDYICTYGHGTLNVPELHLTGREKPDWKQHEDIWTELFQESSKRGDSDR
jgi:hypothetical protein